jgi:GPH family glycoside/pentoside/hexuronide:cation symporter
MEPGFGKRIFFGLGGSVFAVKEAAYVVFVLVFYNQVLGLSGSVTGFVLFLSVLWDAISDPLVGTWSDRVNSRWGRRHPFMVAGAIPLGIGLVGLFAPPQAVVDNPMLLAAWLLFWSLWIRTAVTLFALPHLALTTELTNGYHERSQLLGMRMGFLFLTTVGLPAFGLFFIFGETDGEDGRFLADNYVTYGWLSCWLVWLFSALAILGTRKTGTAGNMAVASEAGDQGLLSDFLRVLHNRNIRQLLYYDLAASVSYGIGITLISFSSLYYWEISAAQTSILLAGPALLAVPLALLSIKPLSKRFPKHRLLGGIVALMLLDAAWMYALRMNGLIPANGHWTIFAMLLIQMFIWLYLFLLRVVTSMSIVADLTDEHELNHGTRQEAGLYSAMSFTTKLASAAGPLFGGVVLDVIGLQESTLPGTAGEGTLDGLAVATTFGVIVPLLLAWYFTFNNSMTEEQLHIIQAELAARKTST